MTADPLPLLDRLSPVAGRHEPLPAGLEVWALDLDATADLLPLARDLLEPAERQRVDGFLRPSSRHRHALSQAALRALLAAQSAADLDLTWTLTYQGKASLKAS